MKLPELTHLSYAVLKTVKNSKKHGRKIRLFLEETISHETSLAAFYQLMSRLKKIGVINGNYCIRVVDGQTIKERVYRITPSGIRMIRETERFYKQFF